MPTATPPDETSTTAILSFPLGHIRLTGTLHEIRRVELLQGHQPTIGKTRTNMPEIMSQAIGQLQEFLRGERKKFTFELKPGGTAFQQLVWRATTKIPYGKTTTYRELAERIANPKAYRAVGQALNCNPLPIFIPCHRVIGSTGQLTGFACGVAIKRFLLEHEQQVLARSQLFNHHENSG